MAGGNIARSVYADEIKPEFMTSPNNANSDLSSVRNQNLVYGLCCCGITHLNLENQRSPKGTVWNVSYILYKYAAGKTGHRTAA